MPFRRGEYRNRHGVRNTRISIRSLWLRTGQAECRVRSLDLAPIPFTKLPGKVPLGKPGTDHRGIEAKENGWSMSKAREGKIGLWAVVAIGVGGMVGGGIFAVLGLAVQMVARSAP